MKYLFSLLILCCSLPAKAQHWAWIHGDSLVGHPGNYGTRLLQAASNMPGAKQGGTFWTDKAGKFWLFGGDAGNSTYKNDLWRYDPVMNQWTWMKGDSTDHGPAHFGKKGVADAANHPGTLLGSTSWTDDSGNLWMFGGIDPSPVNALWKYSIASNEWTWVSGDSTRSQRSVYGTRGVAAPGNKPGSRRWAKGWTDASGNMWLFGGHGITLNGTHGWLNDIWMYSPGTDMWTWIGGDTIGDAPSVRGTRGIAAPGNTPSGRGAYALWQSDGGSIWIYGGRSTIPYSDNDLWKYDPALNQWAWMGGDSSTWDRVYSPIYRFAAKNRPGSRNYCTYWRQGNSLYLMGGYAPAVTGPFGVGAFNDIWKYDISLDQWAWMGGDTAGSAPGIYGIPGVHSRANWPGGREDAYFWQDGSGKLYLFGGTGFGARPYFGGYLNDLWMLDYTKLDIRAAHSRSSFVALPNPSAAVFSIRGKTPAGTAAASYIIADVLGRVVAQGTWPLAAGILDAQLDMGGSPGGIYHLQLYIGRSREHIRLVLQ